MADHGYTGGTSLKRRAVLRGVTTTPPAGGMAGVSQRNILSLENNPDNPLNNSYFNVINRGGYPNSVVAGRSSAQFEIHTMLKPYNQATGAGWSDAAIFISLLSLASDGNTDVFDALFVDEILNREYDWSRCSMVEFSAAAVGGPIAVRMRFNSRWGDNECPYGTTLLSGETIPVAPTFTPQVSGGLPAPDAGQAANVIKMGFATMDKVKAFNLMVMRPQGNQYHFNGDRAPEDIVSGQLSGLLTVEQEADATTFITDTGTETISFCTDKTNTTGKFHVDLLLKLDRRVKNPIPGIVSVASTFSLYDDVLGGNPCVFTAG